MSTMDTRGSVTATAAVTAAYARIAAADRPEVWIELRPEAEVRAEAAEVERLLGAGADLPLAGLLFAAKGNIDIRGLVTTAACPAYGQVAETDATVVARLRSAGAVCLGATNLDQFATGLVGTRSPYGAVRHAFRPEYISGGSSSGSAVAVALGLVDFALGTDTAGSGRVPAAFHGLVGIKPTRGLVSAAGVVPACRSLDCVTVLAGDLDLAETVAGVMAGFDPRDPLSRTAPAGPSTAGVAARIGVPRAGQLGTLAPGWAEAFDAVVARLRAGGAELVEIDIEPFLATARMLYEGAFVAERYAAVGAFVEAHPDEVDPVVGAIVAGARDVPAHRLFSDLEALDVERAGSRQVFAGIDALLLPTTVEHPTLAEVAAEPLAVNSRLGRFTNFANLLDLAAIAVPGGMVGETHFGVQLVGPAFTDARLAGLARRILPAGQTGRPAAASAAPLATQVPAAAPAVPAATELPAAKPVVPAATEQPGSAAETQPDEIVLAVAGAHLSGQPLNHQLTALEGRLLETTTTAADYRLFALDTVPPKPGLVRVAAGAGAPIEVELWALGAAEFGRFVAALPQPMAIGRLLLADGSQVEGFLCEPIATETAADITATGGWRAYLAR
ncbi:allophanate hydrolase [Cryobacterium sp. 1639]|uniref:allophanate hydrolase n=1 Tax=Cryobacterium inferilacus TaxID=2866629 RepID=UPI001C7371A3|nr:allophanate hydrolase [Cryobacterium sp. 1639]MBX0301770.1 allophanate hydrolase [Cryobacterium sp. 1639]